MSKGWTGESTRHRMSAYGIKSGRKSKLNIVPTYVPRGSGNNQYAGKRDLHYKIEKWGYVFPTKKDAEKYANTHEEKNGIITEVKSKPKVKIIRRNDYLWTVYVDGKLQPEVWETQYDAEDYSKNLLKDNLKKRFQVLSGNKVVKTFNDRDDAWNFMDKNKEKNYKWQVER